ncbi:MAG TPA: hypothetical protein VM204_01650 [Gaiellaceae bacterium]|nr:hypothetical protein [Gaiellaceae bacterium]
MEQPARRVVAPQLDDLEPRPRGDLAQALGGVAAAVARRLVRRAEELGPPGDAQQHVAAGPSERRPLPQRGDVVVEVLEHLEGADEVVGAGRRRLAQHPSGEDGLGRGERAWVGLDAGVVAAEREPRPDRSAPRAELEHRPRRHALDERPDDVPPQRALDRQRRRHRG